MLVNAPCNQVINRCSTVVRLGSQRGVNNRAIGLIDQSTQHIRFQPSRTGKMYGRITIFVLDAYRMFPFLFRFRREITKQQFHFAFAMNSLTSAIVVARIQHQINNSRCTPPVGTKMHGRASMKILVREQMINRGEGLTIPPLAIRPLSIHTIISCVFQHQFRQLGTSAVQISTQTTQRRVTVHILHREDGVVQRFVIFMFGVPIRHRVEAYGGIGPAVGAFQDEAGHRHGTLQIGLGIIVFVVVKLHSAYDVKGRSMLRLVLIVHALRPVVNPAPGLVPSPGVEEVEYGLRWGWRVGSISILHGMVATGMAHLQIFKIL
mmetsp:Transcript_10579/g.29735  ORF Transcript_10579/g.29735 Transcript_10579/m.29735 type:complete len:320 (-) Transcript_10579:74-1033(-)